MGGPIIISYDELNNAVKGLAFVKEQLEGIEEFAEKICGQIGDPDPDFRDEVRDFESSWNDNRKDIVDVVGKMGDAAKKIVDDWEKFDADAGKQLHQGLNGEGNGPAPERKPGTKQVGQPGEPSPGGGQPGQQPENPLQSPNGGSSCGDTPYTADHKGQGGVGLPEDIHSNPDYADAMPDNKTHQGDALHQNNPILQKPADDAANIIDTTTGLPVKDYSKMAGHDTGELIGNGPEGDDGLEKVQSGVTGKVFSAIFEAGIRAR